MNGKNEHLREYGYFRGLVLALTMPVLLLGGAAQSYGMGMGGGGSTTCSTPSTFNVVDSGADPVSGKITTKIAGAPIELEIAAIYNGSTCSGFAGSKTVKITLLASQEGDETLDQEDCTEGDDDFTSIPSYSGTISFSSGKATVTLPAVPDAWRNVYVHVSYTYSSGSMGGMGGMGGGTTTITGCSSDNFAIRPYRFNINASDTDWQSAGTDRALANSDGIVHKAGRPFTITVTAVNAADNTTGNYSGSPTVALSPCTGAGCPANLGTLTPDAPWNISGGTFTTNTASYSEVGAFSLKLTDNGAFASVDANDDEPASQRDITSMPPDSPPTYVGRFVPDHFVLTPANTPQFQTFGASGGDRSFTYIGQPFGYATAPQATITAKNYAGGTTHNYAGDLWKLTAAGVTQRYSPLAPASPALDTGLIGTPTVTDNGDGSGTVSVNTSDQLAFVRDPGAPQAPFAADITLTIDAKDSSEAAVSGNGTIATTTPAVFDGGGAGIAFDAGNQLRYGRLKLGNAYGSVQLALPIPIETQYWNGTAFITNTADNGTAIPASAVTLDHFQGKLESGETAAVIGGPFAAGRGDLSLSKPSGGNAPYNGSVDVSVNLGATGADLPWLLGKWSGTSYDQSPPAARAVFGIYGNGGGDGNGLIYLRENYN